MSDVNLNLVPVSFEVQDLGKEMTVKCLLINTANGMKYNYQTPFRTDSGYTIVYYADATTHISIGQILDETNINIDDLDLSQPIALVGR